MTPFRVIHCFPVDETAQSGPVPFNKRRDIPNGFDINDLHWLKTDSEPVLNPGDDTQDLGRTDHQVIAQDNTFMKIDSTQISDLPKDFSNRAEMILPKHNVDLFPSPYTSLNLTAPGQMQKPAFH
ncbi:MAG: hypothetical protein ACWGQW_14055 [bacterium]